MRRSVVWYVHRNEVDARRRLLGAGLDLGSIDIEAPTLGVELRRRYGDLSGTGGVTIGVGDPQGARRRVVVMVVG